MNKSEKKPIIGILGGIGAGKSTVAAEFVKLGCEKIDADEIAHKVLARKEVVEKIVNFFGKAILDSKEKIDRNKLADIVLAGSDDLSLLNRIVHPLVLARTEELINRHNRNTNVKAIVLDMPLLAEIGWDKRCDKLVFIDCRRQLRLARMRKKTGFNENRLKIRESFQISLDKKVAIADNILYNNSGFSALVKQVAEVFTSIVGY